MRQRAHLLRVDDLLVLAAFLRAFGTFERVDLLPAGEVDRLDTAGSQQTVDGFRIAVSGHATAFGGLGQVLQHVGDDEQRVGLGGADQADRTTLGPTGGVQTLTPEASVVMRPSPFALARCARRSSYAMPGAVAGL